MLKSHFAKAVLAQLPVIGPHTDIEPELLLAGIKPIGWLNLYPDDFYPQERDFGRLDEEKLKELRVTLKKMHHKIDMRRRLDEEVAKGNLKSEDVVYPAEGPDGKDSVCRVYCQPEYEQEMRMIAAVNRKFARGERLTAEENKNFKGKDMGEYLGYRKRDTLLFRLTSDAAFSKFLPDMVLDAIFAVNRTLTQLALREILMDKAAKQCEKKGISLKPK